jgi:hypothetical protein
MHRIKIRLIFWDTSYILKVWRVSKYTDNFGTNDMNEEIEKVGYDIKSKNIEHHLMTPSEQLAALKARGERATTVDIQPYDTNPFMVNLGKDGFAVKVSRKKINEDVRAKNMVTGEVGGNLAIGFTEVRDVKSFVKLYAGMWHFRFSLSGVGLRMLFVLIAYLQELPHGTDRIHLNQKIFEEILQRVRRDYPDQANTIKSLSRNSYFKAMREMIEYDFLAPATYSREIFWVNPAQMFNGNRITLFHQIDVDRENDADTNKDTKKIEGAQRTLDEVASEVNPLAIPPVNKKS